MKVLFVCTGNTCRSPIAEALMKKYNPRIQVDSAGTHAYYKIVDITREYLKRRKADQYLKTIPQGLDGKHLVDFDLIVVMEQQHKFGVLKQCPQCEDKIVVWDIADPYYLSMQESEKIFRDIKCKVKELVKNL